MADDGSLRGARRARHVLTDHYRAHLNDRIAALAANDPTGALVPVEEWQPAWIPSNQVQKWPVLMVTSHTGTIVERIDWENGDPVYRWNWLTRTWIWARGDNYLQTADRVEAIAGAVIDELLGNPALSEQDKRIRVLPQPLTLSLSDVEPAKKMRASIAGAFVEAIVTMAETATADPPLGVATSFDLNVDLKDPTA